MLPQLKFVILSSACKYRHCPYIVRKYSFQNAKQTDPKVIPLSSIESAAPKQISAEPSPEIIVNAKPSTLRVPTVIFTLAVGGFTLFNFYEVRMSLFLQN